MFWPVFKIGRGVRVTMAGALVNLSLGILYAWSVFAEGLIGELGFSRAEAVFPYTLELVTFALAMLFGGWFQGRFGPRLSIQISGLLTGLALILCGVTATVAWVTIFFGLIYGPAAALGYAAVTPAVIRWFPPTRRGLVTGIVIMSMGAAPLFWSPVINALIANYGIVNSFYVSGFFLLLVINGCATLIDIPAVEMGGVRLKAGGGEWRQVIRLPSFRIMWLIFGLSGGVGVMFVGNLVQIAALNYRVPWGYLLVSLYAGMSACGRLVGGVLSDRIGAINNLKTALLLMAIATLLFLAGGGSAALVIATGLLGFAHGSTNTSTPTIVANLYGLENFGFHYGMIFTAIGLIGSLAPLVAAGLAELAASYTPAFLLGFFASLACFYLSSRLREEALGAA